MARSMEFCGIMNGLIKELGFETHMIAADQFISKKRAEGKVASAIEQLRARLKPVFSDSLRELSVFKLSREETEQFRNEATKMATDLFIDSMNEHLQPIHEMSKEKPADEPSKKHEPTELPNENNSEHLPTENAPDKAADKLTSDTVKESEETYDLAKGSKEEWIDEFSARRNSNPSTERGKTRTSMSGRRNSKAEGTPPNATVYSSNPSTSKNDLLQVYIGNIPKRMTEDDIRRIFSRFGHLVCVRLYYNKKKPETYSASIRYENMQSVQNCLAEKNTFYWSENSRNEHKLIVSEDMNSGEISF